MSPLTIIFQVVCAFIGVVTLAVLFQIPKEYLLYAGITGAGGWLVELIVLEVSESPTFSAFWASLFVAVLSQIFARVSKAPVTVYLVRNNSELTSYYFSYTLQIAGMIALAIFVVDSFMKILYRKHG